jgi:cytoskeletal protein CcmA (bactofilin family)
MLKNILNKPTTHKTSDVQKSSLPDQTKVKQRQRSKSVTIVGPDTRMNGSIESDGIVEVVGSMDGKISSTLVTIRSSGSFSGEIISECLHIQGTVDAKVETDSVTIFPGGVAKGSFSYNKIKIEDGGRFEGQLNPILANEEKKSKHIA